MGVHLSLSFCHYDEAKLSLSSSNINYEVYVRGNFGGCCHLVRAILVCAGIVMFPMMSDRSSTTRGSNTPSRADKVSRRFCFSRVALSALCMYLYHMIL